MISYRESIRLIDKISLKLANETVSTVKAINRVCAEDVLSPIKNPPHNNTAFDGFAVLSKETKGLTKKNKKKFKILKTITAGEDPKINNYEKNSVVEIMTGALVPDFYDSILPVEKAKYFPSKEKATHIIIDEKVNKSSYIRFAGEDYNIKDVVVKKGELIQPKHLMALTTLGIKEITVKKIPKIIFFGTGNEITDYKEENVPAWKVRNSNNYYLEAFAKSLNLEIIDGGTIKDDEPEKLRQSLKDFINSDINLFVTSGAISAGKYDFIPKLVEDCGFKKYFKGVSIKPGKPMMLSTFKDKLFFGLPGNPISCAAGFRFFIYPLLRNILGMPKEKTSKGKLVNTYSKNKNFTHFSRCFMKTNKQGQCEIRVLQGQQSHRIRSFTQSNCWAIFSQGKEKFKKGDLTDFLTLI
ncbi:MAG: molybdopterin molybdotransferase MoeA [Pelagibacteraceae bacterium]|nr:molybdopterin molybdotransferase MoeA [Pelagibacteraceae bacterium]